MEDKFEYEFNGMVLSMEDMSEINSYYEAASTAEYLMDNYGFDKDDALDKGYEVRRLMDDFGYYEEEAIEEIIDR